MACIEVDAGIKKGGADDFIGAALFYESWPGLIISP